MSITEAGEDRTATGEDPVDEGRVEEFSQQLFGLFTGAMLTYMVEIGRRTDLFAAAAQGPATSGELADRAGLTERSVREWAGALVTAGILDHDPATATYRLPPEHAACLVGTTSTNMTPLSDMVTALGTRLPRVVEAFHHGRGVPYEEYRPDFTAAMDAIGRGTFDELLIDALLPLAGDLVDRLRAGMRVADLGCGTGHALNLMARAYPRSRFIGYDLADDAIASARREAGDLGLDNVRFEVRDVLGLPTDPGFDAVFAFDAVHDQADPAGVLARAHEAVRPGGWFVMVDINAHTDLADNVGNPLAPFLYAVSTLHCLQVSLAQDGAGLGTVWGRELARRMLSEAGFVDVEVHEAPGDPFDLVYVSRKFAMTP